MKRRDFLKAVGASGAAAIVPGGNQKSISKSGAGVSATPASEKKWWKGNLHTHTHWSDGDHYPDMVAKWYKEHGYNFLCLSDHHVLSRGIRWIDVEQSKGKQKAYNAYLNAFGKEWVQERQAEGAHQARLKPLDELRHLLGESANFILIESQEITDRDGIHCNGINLQEAIKAQGGQTAAEVIANNVRSVAQQQQQTGQKMICTINHPNFFWSLTAEDISPLPEAQFMEVFNSGHRLIYNDGDENHVSVDRMWDIVLTKRLAELSLPIVYGVAVDDAHHYHGQLDNRMNPGRGWVCVRSVFLTPESLFEAMEKGDFYASTGVTLNDIRFEDNQLHVEIQPEEGVSYKTQFIGTKKGYDPSGRPTFDSEGKELRARSYSDAIGKVLAEAEGTSVSYKLTQDNIYVRAKVISSKPREIFADKFQTAWLQPVELQRREETS